MVDKTEGITWRFPITEKFLKSKGIKMEQSRLLFAVENNYEVKIDGMDHYTTHITNPNENLRVCRREYWTNTAEVPTLFGKGSESLDVGVMNPPYDIKVGLASAGREYNDVYLGRNGVAISFCFDQIYWVPVYDQPDLGQHAPDRKPEK